MGNIVLIGMMGCGKTTCGQLLAQRLARPFVDSDQLIAGYTGQSIPQFFATHGEEAFRQLESQVLQELGAQTGLVIATGGGAPLRQANVEALRRNGTLFFLHRPAQEIYRSGCVSDRPLAQEGEEAFLNTFQRRLPAYRAAADEVILDFSSPQATVEEILRRLEEPAMHFLILNGPNLNLLGKREPEVYGAQTYAHLCQLITDHAQAHHAQATCYQSNHEGDLIDQIHQADGVYDAIIINPGAYTHYSYAILDALKAVDVPAYEVHISHIDQREPFRTVSVTAPACVGQLWGHGLQGYLMAMDYFLEGRQWAPCK